MANKIAIGEVSITKIREMMGNVIPESSKGTINTTTFYQKETFWRSLIDKACKRKLKCTTKVSLKKREDP